MFKIIDCGDTDLIVGNVVSCNVDRDKFNVRYGRGMRKVSILLHLWGKVFTFPKDIKVAKI